MNYLNLSSAINAIDTLIFMSKQRNNKNKIKIYILESKSFKMISRQDIKTYILPELRNKGYSVRLSFFGKVIFVSWRK